MYEVRQSTKFIVLVIVRWSQMITYQYRARRCEDTASNDQPNDLHIIRQWCINSLHVYWISRLLPYYSYSISPYVALGSVLAIHHHL